MEDRYGAVRTGVETLPEVRVTARVAAVGDRISLKDAVVDRAAGAGGKTVGRRRREYAAGVDRVVFMRGSLATSRYTQSKEDKKYKPFFHFQLHVL